MPKNIVYINVKEIIKKKEIIIKKSDFDNLISAESIQSLQILITSSVLTIMFNFLSCSSIGTCSTN